MTIMDHKSPKENAFIIPHYEYPKLYYIVQTALFYHFSMQQMLQIMQNTGQ